MLTDKDLWIIAMLLTHATTAFLFFHWGRLYGEGICRWWRLRYLLFCRRWVQRRPRFNSKIILGR